MKNSIDKRILFFDGVCNLCNDSIDFYIRKDTEGNLHYASLQSDFAIDFLADYGYCVDSINTVLFYDNGKIEERSRAVGNSLLYLPWPYRWLGRMILLVPAFLADPIYNILARNRYRWFGKKKTCRLPSKEEEAYFLSE